MKTEAASAPKMQSPLVSRRAWLVIAVISLLVAINDASRSHANNVWEWLPLVLGGLIGGLALLGGGWATLMLLSRWIYRLQQRAAVTRGGKAMNQHDMLFILTLCELVCPDKNVEPNEVERAYEEAKRKLENHRGPTSPGYISRAPHR